MLGSFPPSYAANRDTPEHAEASAFLAKAATRPERHYLSEGIIYEFLRVATHPRVFPQPLTASEAVAFLTPLLASSSIELVRSGERHWESLTRVVEELTHPCGNLFFDIRTAALMREHGIRKIYTADTDFLQFRGIEVVNPLHRT